MKFGFSVSPGRILAGFSYAVQVISTFMTLVFASQILDAEAYISLSNALFGSFIVSAFLFDWARLSLIRYQNDSKLATADVVITGIAGSFILSAILILLAEATEFLQIDFSVKLKYIVALSTIQSASEYILTHIQSKSAYARYAAAQFLRSTCVFFTFYVLIKARFSTEMIVMGVGSAHALAAVFTAYLGQFSVHIKNGKFRVNILRKMIGFGGNISVAAMLHTGTLALIRIASGAATSIEFQHMVVVLFDFIQRVYTVMLSAWSTISLPDIIRSFDESGFSAKWVKLNYLIGPYILGSSIVLCQIILNSNMFTIRNFSVSTFEKHDILAFSVFLALHTCLQWTLGLGPQLCRKTHMLLINASLELVICVLFVGVGNMIYGTSDNVFLCSLTLGVTACYLFVLAFNCESEIRITAISGFSYLMLSAALAAFLSSFFEENAVMALLTGACYVALCGVLGVYPVFRTVFADRNRN